MFFLLSPFVPPLFFLLHNFIAFFLLINLLMLYMWNMDRQQQQLPRELLYNIFGLLSDSGDELKECILVCL
jgi:hypothetical protein